MLGIKETREHHGKRILEGGRQGAGGKRTAQTVARGSNRDFPGRINNWYVRETLPRVDDAVAIAKALGVNVRQLVTGQTIMSLGTLPNHMQELMKRYAALGERDRERLLVICRAVMGLMEQGVLDMPLDAYLRLTRQGRGKPSGFPPPDESDQDEYISE